MTDESHAGDADAADRQGTGSGGIESRVFLRPIASPLTLGFLALGGATLILSGSQLGWFPLSETRYVALVLMAFGAPLQLLSSVFGFLARGEERRARDVPGFRGRGAPRPGHRCGFRSARACRRVGDGGAPLPPHRALPVEREPGLAVRRRDRGLVLLAVAYYAALALAIEEVRHKTVLPVLHVGEGKASLEGGAADQVERVEHEAGVREQL